MTTIELPDVTFQIGPGEFWLVKIPAWQTPKVCVTLENLGDHTFIVGTEEAALMRWRVVTGAQFLCRVDIPLSLGYLQEMALKNKAVLESKAPLAREEG